MSDRLMVKLGSESSRDFEEHWRRRFETYGATHEDDAGIAGWSPSGLDARFRRFVQLSRDRPAPAGKRWLDAGCGAATYSRFLAEQGAWVAGFDYSLPTLYRAAERCGNSVHLAAADVTRLPLRDATLDGALCFGVMQALASPTPAIGELMRVLRPGGVLWVDALNVRCLPTRLAELRRRLRGRAPHLRYDRPRALKSLLRDAGFVNVRLHWIPILPGRMASFQAVLEARPVQWLLRVLPFAGGWLSHAFVLEAERPREVQR